MLITFSSDAYENITFMGDVAFDMLRMMGCHAAPRGVIKAENVASALSQIKITLETMKDKPSGQTTDPEERPISLGNRAVTLIEMLEASVKEKCDVSWKNG